MSEQEMKEQVVNAAQSIAQKVQAEIKVMDKSPLKSKKFLFASVWNCIWLGLIAYAIHQKLDPSVQIALVYSAALIQGLYLGGQSFVDALVRSKLGGK